MNHAERMKYIGGSDIAAVMGLSRWSSPLQLWAEKTGKIPPKDLSALEHVEIGTDLEEYVAQKFTKKTGYKIRRDQRTFTHADYPYMVGHIDRWVCGEDAILECKTTSGWNAREWEGEDMPKEYILQVMWYLGLVGKTVGYVACLIGGQKFAWKEIKFDDALFKNMVEAARSFWEDFVLTGLPPVASAFDGDTLEALFPGSNESTIHFEAENNAVLNDLIEQRQGGVEQMNLVKEEVERLSNLIKQHLGEATYGQTDQYKISWKSQSRTTPDSDQLKRDGLFEMYSKTSTFKVLRTSKLKGA